MEKLNNIILRRKNISDKYVTYLYKVLGTEEL